jgi:unsaturated chondroitin disaccharide hydrolase
LTSRRAAAAASTAAVAVVLYGCGGGSGRSAATAPAPEKQPPAALGHVEIVSVLRVDGRSSRSLPAHWAVSFDLRGQVRASVPVRNGHGEAAGSKAATLSFTGHGRVENLIVSTTRAALLLHRLAELHARLGPGQFPIGADVRDHLHIDSTYWTSGFWPGALWQAAALAPMFSPWALAATIRHFGHEHADTHDVGFQYGQSSLAAYMALCRSGRAQAALCSRLRRSVIEAADELMRLAASNARAGTIPTNSTGSQADTIVDSMMNIAILPWASELTSDPAYARVASRHAHRVAALLVRADGSTTQAVNFDRATGRVVSFATHQGLSERSTWSRGEGWALYGFAQAASELRDRSLLRVAMRAAHYISGHLPPGAVPRWDYDAPAGAPLDVSAGVITAAGLLHLAAACRQLERSCPAAAGWVSLSRRMLAGALGFASTQPPLGFLAGQVLDERARREWFNGGELSFGLSYALEAVKLQRQW